MYEIVLELSFLNFFLNLMQPYVDFGLMVMGGDIMSIPGVYRLVQVQS